MSQSLPKERRIILKNADNPAYSNRIGCYLREGGYQNLKKAIGMKPEEVGEEVLKSGVRGRGGAGFPAGMKWKFLDRKSGKPIYLICNADESEPGTFKDRQIMYKDPHQLIEGMMIAAYAIGAKQAFIYIRAEFHEGARILNRAISEAKEGGGCGNHILDTAFSGDLVVHRGAGAYICGDETGVIESLEGKRPNPGSNLPISLLFLGSINAPPLSIMSKLYAMSVISLRWAGKNFQRSENRTTRVPVYGVYPVR